MFGLNRKKKQTSAAEQVTAPIRGTLLPMDQVPDPVFSGGLLGPGFAVDPADGIVVAPVAGTVVTVPDSRHAVGLRTAGGAELLIHVGVDTVTLKGEGFTAHCAEGDAVDAGAVLLEVDLDAIRGSVPSLISPVIVTNAADLSVSEADLSAAFGQPVLTISVP